MELSWAMVMVSRFPCRDAYVPYIPWVCEFCEHNLDSSVSRKGNSPPMYTESNLIISSTTLRKLHPLTPIDFSGFRITVSDVYNLKSGYSQVRWPWQTQFYEQMLAAYVYLFIFKIYWPLHKHRAELKQIRGPNICEIQKKRGGRFNNWYYCIIS